MDVNSYDRHAPAHSGTFYLGFLPFVLSGAGIGVLFQGHYRIGTIFLVISIPLWLLVIALGVRKRRRNRAEAAAHTAAARPPEPPRPGELPQAPGVHPPYP
ncbi:hypothetical protein ABZ639_06985 [Saccharomonospora sp. NPDC006951]